MLRTLPPATLQTNAPVQPPPPTPKTYVVQLREEVLLENIPLKVHELVQLIERNQLFTPEQKAFATSWEAKFATKFSLRDATALPKMVFFLGKKVISPAACTYQNNRLACEQLSPIVQAHRALLASLLPEENNRTLEQSIEKFINECEEIYDSMLETKALLSADKEAGRQSQREIIRAAMDLKEQKLSHSNQERAILLQQAQQRQESIRRGHTRLSQLGSEIQSVNQSLQTHARQITSIGTELAATQQAFQSTNHQLKEQLNKVIK